MEIGVLGRLEVLSDGRPIEIRRPMERALLTLLAAEPGRVVSADRLVEGLWRDSPPTTAAKTLQTHVHHLRSLLPEGAIVTEGPGYRLLAEESDIDIFRFSAAVSAAHSALDGDPAHTAELLTKTISLWRGAPFLDAEESMALQPLRARLEAQLLQAVTDSIDARIRIGRHDETIPELRSLLEEHPLREDLWGWYMLALYRGGRQAEALRAFAVARRRLGEELGIEPGPELQRLEDRILAQDDDLLLQMVGEKAPERLEPTETPSMVSSRPERKRLLTVVLSELLATDEVIDAAGKEDGERILDDTLGVLASAWEAAGGTVVSRKDAGLVVAYGIPLAREDDTYRAIRAALDLDQVIETRSRDIERSWGVAHFGVRSALGAGPVTVSGERYEGLDEKVASLRELLTSGAVGEVLVDDHTHDLMGDLFDWRAVDGPKDRTTWLVEAVRREADKARMDRRLHAPLIGRVTEMGIAETALDSLQRGIGGVLVVSGEAGVGKTRLVVETSNRSSATSTTWLTGHCVSYGEASPYWPFRDLFRDWLELGVDDTDVKARVALHRRLDELLPAEADRLYPYLGGVLGVPLEPDHAARLDLASEALRYRTFEVIIGVLEGLARRGPLVIVVEDLHWADPTSLALMEQLLPLTETQALLLVLTTRPEPDHPSRQVIERSRGDMPHLTQEIMLPELDEDDQQAMLHALVGATTLPPPTARQILRLAEGNPFFLEELLGSLADEGALVPTEDGWRFDHEADITVPETVERVVQARIDRLRSDAHLVVTAASVLGRSFGLPLLQGVVGEHGALVESVQDLLRVGLLIEARRWPHAEYLFRHVLIQEAAYLTLTPQRRIELHRVAAEWLEHRYQDREDEVAPMLARHWAAAGDEEGAIGALIRAGDLARRDHALDESIDHYRELLPILERRGDRRAMALVLFKLAMALHTGLRFAESNATYQRAFDLWDPEPSAETEVLLRFAGPSVTEDPDPVRSYNLQDIQLQMALFDRLVQRWPDDTIVPSLAHRWSVSDDGLTYRFHLRPGLEWSDGRPLTATDAEFGIMRNLDPERPGVGVSMFYVLEGAQDFVQGRISDPGLVGVEAIDELTVEFRLLAPAPYFLGMLNRPDSGPQPRHAIESEGAGWALTADSIVSGAFRRRSVGSVPVTLEWRPDQLGNRIGNVRVVEWHQGHYGDLIDRYLDGGLDLLWIRANYDGSKIDRVPRSEVSHEPPAFLFYLVFDTTGPQAGDPRLRLGLAHGIDRSAWNQTLPEYVRPAWGGIVPPALNGHTPDIAPRFDPELGARLVAEVGVDEVRVGSLDIPEHILPVLVESLAEMWTRNLGIRVVVVPFDPYTESPVFSGEDRVDAFPAVWYPGYTDPEYFLRLLLHSEAKDNFGRFSDPEFDRLVEEARQERDERARLSLFHQADRLAVAKLAAVIPLAYGQNLSLSRGNVHGWWEFGKSWANFADLSVESLGPAQSPG